MKNREVSMHLILEGMALLARNETPKITQRHLTTLLVAEAREDDGIALQPLPGPLAHENKIMRRHSSPPFKARPVDSTPSLSDILSALRLRRTEVPVEDDTSGWALTFGSFSYCCYVSSSCGLLRRNSNFWHKWSSLIRLSR